MVVWKVVQTDLPVVGLLVELMGPQMVDYWAVHWAVCLDNLTVGH